MQSDLHLSNISYFWASLPYGNLRALFKGTLVAARIQTHNL